MRKNSKRDIIVIGFALFSMFFGAGNVIFPPYLGLGAAGSWLGAFLSYYIVDIGLALVAIAAMLKCNSDVEGITYRIGKIPASLFTSIIVLCIGPLLAIPRTAASTYEMTVIPLVGNIGLGISSIIFFLLIYLLARKESTVVEILGKFLTPALFIGLLVLIIKGAVDPIGPIREQPVIENVIAHGIAAGYQTMDVLAALLFGVIIIKTVMAKGYTSNNEKLTVVGGASIVAGIVLFIVYYGLTYLGATASTLYTLEIDRGTLIVEIIKNILGFPGIVVLGIVVALACITTAIALVSATATYFSRLANNRISYQLLVIIICVFSTLISNVGLSSIIAIAAPILGIVYPGALTLIILSFFGDKIKNDNVFKCATLGAILASALEIMESYGTALLPMYQLPLFHLGFGWILPTVLFGFAGALIKPENPMVEVEDAD